MAGPIVTLLTDFGLADSYVGVMKGVMVGINPDLSLVDLTHDVAPQDILQGAFLLGTAWRYFPTGTIHLAVVDPGVGTGRRALLVEGRGHIFLAPDNGLLSFVLLREETDHLPFQPYQVSVPEGFRAYVLTNASYWHHPVSDTFHGRDIFAPVAGHLSVGLAADRVGESVDSMTRLAIPVPQWRENRLVGHVLHIDRFGNVVTNVSEQTLPGGNQGVEVEVGGSSVRGLVSSYAEGEGLVALIGSHDYLEIAMTNGSAARSLETKVGDEVVVRKG